MTPQTEIITGLLEKFPNAGSRTLGRMAYKQHPTVFASGASAYSAVRYARGAIGKTHRKYAATKTFFREPTKGGDPFGAVPKGLTHFADWQAVKIAGPLHALILADIHIPYHVREVVQLALRHGKERKVDMILLNGDLADFFSCSFWEKDPRKRDLAGEVKACREFLLVLREAFPKARIIFKEGNHEERWTRYLRVKAPEVLGMPEFELQKVLTFDSLDIEFVGDKRPIQLGKLNVIHGHEYKFGVTSPVNPARGYFLRAKTHCLGSHLHQTSQHSEKNLEEKVVSTWSTGCLCDLHPDYNPLNSWNHGFAIVEADKAGAFHVDNLKIIDGKIY